VAAEPAPLPAPPLDLTPQSSPLNPQAGVEPVAQRLASARRALGAGRVAEAEKLAEGVLSGRASAREAAEARTLLADCAVSRGQPERAALLYLAVAKSFPGLPAGENALFAGARLTERVYGKARAQGLFEQYLQRYPRGRFRQEAERHLGSSTTR
jgi:TolA-binding protein